MPSGSNTMSSASRLQGPRMAADTEASTSSSTAVTSEPSKWHSIRPWNSQLSLHTKEITSVSVTFILATEPTTTTTSREGETSGATLRITSPPACTQDASQPCETAPALATSTNARGAGEHENDVRAENDEPSDEPKSTKPSPTLLTQILQQQRTLQTKVNNVNWQRVLIRIDENGDEAVIIVYGLMPGREYDIDLAIVQPQALPGVPQLEGQADAEGGHVGEAAKNATASALSLGRRQVLTFDTDNSDPDNMAEVYSSTDPGDTVSNSSNSDPPQALSTPSTSPSRTIPNTPPATPPPAHSSLSASGPAQSSVHPDPQPSTAATLPTLEDRLNQLRQKLHTVNAERETLASSLKSARRESNKKDAALKAEIDALKRASEKFSANELRQRQKILALQESVKRAQAATRETQQLVRDVEAEVPDVLKEKEKKEKEHEYVKREADKVAKEKKERVEEEKKKREGMKNELSALTNKLEKLNAKKERQETVVIPNLQDKLQQVRNEIEEEERMLEMFDRMERERELVRDYEMALAQQQASRLHGTSSVNGSPTQIYPTARLGLVDSDGFHHAQSRSRGRSFSSSLQPQPPGPNVGISRPSLPGPIQRPNFSSGSTSSTPPQLHSQSISRKGTMEDGNDFSPLAGVGAYGNTIWGPPLLGNRSSGLPLVASPITASASSMNDELDGRAAAKAQQLVNMFTADSDYDVPLSRHCSGSPSSPAQGLNSGTYNLVAGTRPPGPSASVSTNSLGNNNTLPLTPPGLGTPSSFSVPVASTSTSSLGSTLSSRAPVFEPRKGGLGLGLKIFTGGSNKSSTAQSSTQSNKSDADAKDRVGSNSGSGKQVLGTGPQKAGNPGVIGAGRSGSGSGSSKS